MTKTRGGCGGGIESLCISKKMACMKSHFHPRPHCMSQRVGPFEASRDAPALKAYTSAWNSNICALNSNKSVPYSIPTLLNSVSRRSSGRHKRGIYIRLLQQETIDQSFYL